MVYQEGTVIKNVCHNCYNPVMTIYRFDSTAVWCRCEKCGAVDDFPEDYLGNGEDIVYPVTEEKIIIPENESEVIYQTGNSDIEGCTYDLKKADMIKTPVELQNFFVEIDAICKKYNLSIAHEDEQGSFIITKYNENTANWLKNAFKSY